MSAASYRLDCRVGLGIRREDHNPRLSAILASMVRGCGREPRIPWKYLPNERYEPSTARTRIEKDLRESRREQKLPECNLSVRFTDGSVELQILDPDAKRNFPIYVTLQRDDALSLAGFLIQIECDDSLAFEYDDEAQLGDARTRLGPKGTDTICRMVGRWIEGCSIWIEFNSTEPITGYPIHLVTDELLLAIFILQSLIEERDYIPTSTADQRRHTVVNNMTFADKLSVLRKLLPHFDCLSEKCGIIPTLTDSVRSKHFKL